MDNYEQLARHQPSRQPPGLGDADRRRPSFLTMAPNVGPPSLGDGDTIRAYRDTGYHSPMVPETPADELHEARYVTRRRGGWPGQEGPDSTWETGEDECPVVRPVLRPFVGGQVADRCDPPPHPAEPRHTPPPHPATPRHQAPPHPAITNSPPHPAAPRHTPPRPATLTGRQVPLLEVFRDSIARLATWICGMGERLRRVAGRVAELVAGLCLAQNLALDSPPSIQMEVVRHTAGSRETMSMGHQFGQDAGCQVYHQLHSVSPPRHLDPPHPAAPRHTPPTRTRHH